jgi:serine phosphatase RsbU (regulator of sigma subunit)/HAMP domain-containing protein
MKYLKRESLVTKLIITTWVVLAVVLAAGALVSLRFSRATMEEQSRDLVKHQTEIYERQLAEMRERQKSRLEPLVKMLGAFSQKPLLNKSWAGDIVLPSQEQFIDNLRNCFARREKELQYQCLSRDVELRVQASLLRLNQEIMESAIRNLLSDEDIQGVAVLDLDDKLYMGFQRDESGRILPVKHEDELDSSLFKMEQEVRIDGDPFGRVVFAYTNKYMERARAQMAEQHESVLSGMYSQAAAQASALTRSRIFEGLILALAAAVAMTFMLFRTAIIPLQKLRKGAESLAQGDFEAPIDVVRRDELGDLARSFSDMRSAILERIEALQQLNQLGQDILVLPKSEEILSSCESFLARNLKAKACKFVLHQNFSSIAVVTALTLPDRFQFENASEEEKQRVQHCCERREVESEVSGSEIGYSFALPFSVRGESAGAFLLFGLDAEPNRETVYFGSTVSHLASTTIENLVMLEEVRIKATLEAALSAAEAVQSAIIPSAPNLPEVRFASHYSAAEKGMGDWYGQYFDPISRRVFVYLGDVTGHGIAAALLTSLVSGAVSASHNYLERSTFKPANAALPAEFFELVLGALNTILRSTGEKVERSLTFSLFALDVDTGHYTFVNCAHPQPFLINSSSGVKTILAAGSSLGLAEKMHYDVVEGDLAPGDRFFFFTDGLTENQGPDGKTLRRVVLKRLLEIRDDAVEGTVSRVCDEAQKIWRDEIRADDVSIVMVEWMGERAS